MNSIGIHYSSIAKYIPLTKKHKHDRYIFSKDLLENAQDFKNVVFSDEKRFSFDGGEWVCFSTR